MVIWIIGLAGSGKTYLAKKIIKKINKDFIHIDGDDFRKNISYDLNYSFNNRYKNAIRISDIVRYLSGKNLNIIVSVLSNFPKILKRNRNKIKNYFEIYVKVDKYKLFNKNKKNLYLSKKKNVVGKDIKFNEPKFSDYIFENNFKREEANKAVMKILKLIKKIKKN